MPERDEDKIRGELAIGARASAPQPCIRSIRGGSNHDAVIRIGGKSSGAAGPFFTAVWKPWVWRRVTTTSDRRRQIPAWAAKLLFCYASLSVLSFKMPDVR
jgi:hypothetical protein